MMIFRFARKKLKINCFLTKKFNRYCSDDAALEVCIDFKIPFVELRAFFVYLCVTIIYKFHEDPQRFHEDPRRIFATSSS